MIYNNEPTYSVYIEIEKHSRVKYEYNKTTHRLEVDRVLPYPYFYPHSYGFFPNTLSEDGDELDVLVLTSDMLGNKMNTIIQKNTYVDVVIVGGLIMEDEKGLDEKIFVVKKGDTFFENLNETQRNELFYNIIWFFSNYKSSEPNKWSVVKGLIEKEDAVSIYNKYKLPEVQTKNALCILTRYFSYSWIEFLSEFSDTYDIYMVIDDNSEKHGISGKSGKVNIIQIDDQECVSSNYYKSSCWTNLKDVISWDKALYFFNRVCSVKYDNVWFIEDDEFLRNESMLLKMDKTYPTSDLLCSFNEINETGETKRGWNHWVNVVHRIGTPWAHSLICICRLSRRLLDRVDDYVSDRHLLFIEALFNTLCLHYGYKIDNPREISEKSIHFNRKWEMDELEADKIYHPIKQAYLHSYIRCQMELQLNKQQYECEYNERNYGL